jgi:hypothetical protein
MALKDVTKPVADLVPDPNNRRQRTPRNLDVIVESLRAVGAARSIVLDESDVVLAGNGVVEGAPQAGIKRVRIIDADGDELIAVRRRGLSDEQKRQLSLADNRAAELATWDLPALGADRDAGLDLRPFWTEAEEAMLLGAGVKPDWSGMPEFTQEDQEAYRTIKVHFRTQADVDAFAALLQQSVTDKTRYLWFPKPERERTDVVFAGADSTESA